MSAKLEFKRVPRVGVPGAYDFDILADGVKVGAWKRDHIHPRRGYYLVDKVGVTVWETIFNKFRQRDDRHGIYCSKQDAFAKCSTKEVLALLPTDEQIAERQRLQDSEREAREEAQRRSNERDRKRLAGPALYDALKAQAAYDARKPGERPPFGHECEWCDACAAKLRDMRNAAIKLADEGGTGETL